MESEICILGNLVGELLLKQFCKLIHIQSKIQEKQVQIFKNFRLKRTIRDNIYLFTLYFMNEGFSSSAKSAQHFAMEHSYKLMIVQFSTQCFIRS